MSRALRYYSKPDCPLCEKSRAVAEALARANGLPLVEVDILGDASLEARFGEKVPVLTLNGVELGWGRLSRRALERELAEQLRRG